MALGLSVSSKNIGRNKGNSYAKFAIIRQGYERNTSSAPANQQGNNGVPQNQD
jgi:hypothetical protein